MSTPAGPSRTAVVSVENLSDPPSQNSTAPAAKAAVALILLIAIAVGLALYAGVFNHELSGETDEAAHYVTGLLVHDYVLNGVSEGPMPFAADFYLHYPKVALGHWPPVFYVIQAAWMLPFGDSPNASLCLVLLMAAALSWLIYYSVRREFGSEPAALACGILFLLIPVVQMYSRMVMADMPVALFMFAATLAWARFMETEQRRFAIPFAVLSSLAILTKGNGYTLVFVPPFSIALTRRWRLIWNGNVWLSGAIVALLTIPWNLITRDLIVPTMQHNFGLRFLMEGSAFYIWKLLVLPGALMIFFAMAGIVFKVALPLWRSRVEPLWAAVFALLLGGEIFHSLVPAGLESRYLLPSFAGLILFMAAGIRWTAALAASKVPEKRTIYACAGVMAVVFFATVFYVPLKRSFGFDQVAASIVDNPDLNQARILCSSGADGEGLLISELARRDKPRPAHLVVRGTQVLARMGWNGDNYTPLVRSTDEVQEVLDAVPADMVVLDRTPGRTLMPHEALVASALAQPSWKLAAVFPREQKRTTVPNARIEVYRRTGPTPPSAGKLRVELQPSPKIVLDRRPR